MIKYITAFCFSVLLISSLIAQPVNDDCSGIIDLGIAPICPHPDTFNNVDATLSIVFSDPAMNIPTCFQGTGDRDVWFQFSTPADIFDFNITVTGVDGDNGMIVQPQVAVYRGFCALDDMSELACFSSAAGLNELTFDLSGLDPLENYFLRINDWSATASPNSGDFVICIKEPDPIYTMGEDTESSLCSGTLFDSGGPDNDYSNSESSTFTICPSVPTNCISLEFLNFNLENNFDNLILYDGPDIGSPQIATLTGSNTFPIQAGNNCLTIQFTSDISVTAPGFEIQWSCSDVPCQTTLIPCLENVAINNLPFTSSGQTTCGSGDDLSDGPCNSNDPVLAGEDFVYTYTPFNDACLNISLENVNINTGLSVYTNCPTSAGASCISFNQNPSDNSLSINNLAVDAFQPLFIVISNGDGCTDFDIQIEEVECLTFAAARSSCEDALILNVCEGLPELFSIAQQPNLNPDFYQPGINDGCWSGVGASHYSWLFFQAQTDGDFGVLIENSDPSESTNINIQVWGPISTYAELCDFMASNQPVRSTGALNNTSNQTGLTNTNPTTGSTVIDVCEDTSGDGFISALPVQEGAFYLILINDFDGNIVNGGMALDFSETTPGVLDGLPEDTELVGQDYTLIGNASYYTENFDFSCIQLTSELNTQLSCVWAENQIDFSQPFSNTITIYLGDNDANGADGICMVYHNSVQGNNICGISGGGIGSSGIDNSFIIEFDTWQNADLGDPVEDHIAVNVNGEMDAPISGPVSMGNIEDGQEHAVTFNWDPATNTYEIFFDGVMIITGVYDIIQNSLQGNPVAYCGFTGSTGGAINLQYACTGDNQYPTAVLDSVSLEICEGESAFLEGAEQTVAGFYTDVYMAITGCDSTVITELMILSTTSQAVDASICEGESIFLEGANQTEAGVYTDTLSNSIGCDSILTTTLIVLPLSTNSTEVTICEGESIFLEGADQTEAGVYMDILSNSTGCDTILTTILNVLPISTGSAEVTICQGESYFVGGAEQTESGGYIDNLISEIGCDSIVTTNLIVIEVFASITPPSLIDCTEENSCTILDGSNSTTGDNVVYNWSINGGIFESNGEISQNICAPGVFTLEVENTIDGITCSAFDSVQIMMDLEVFCDDYDIPNAFTPNGDGISDIFELVTQGENFQVNALKIFNRWGQIVHEASGPDHGWDGRHNDETAPSDVYYFIFEINNADTGESIREAGDLTLVR